MVVTTLKVKGCVRNVETVVKRNYSRFNYEEYNIDLLGKNWTGVYDLKDPTLIDSFITDTILEVLNVHAPIQKYQSRGNKYKEGKKLSGECVDRIKERNRLRIIAKRSNKTTDWDN